jgi:hypothetical protein
MNLSHFMLKDVNFMEYFNSNKKMERNIKIFLKDASHPNLYLGINGKIEVMENDSDSEDNFFQDENNLYKFEELNEEESWDFNYQVGSSHSIDLNTSFLTKNNITHYEKENKDFETTENIFEKNINEEKEETNLETTQKEITSVPRTQTSGPNKLIKVVLKKLDSKLNLKKFDEKIIVKVGDRIQIIEDGELGFVRYIGVLKGKKVNKKPDLRTWIGIEFDKEGVGKNDGMVFGVRYYQTKPETSVFVIYEKESFLKTFQIIEFDNMLSGNEYIIEDKKWKDFTKTGPGKKWKRFKSKDGNIYYGNMNTNKPQWEIPEEFIEFDKIQDYDGIIQVGDKIQHFMTQNIGIIRYIGKLENCSTENKFKNWFGIEWEIGTGKNDGIAFGVRYYQTKPNSSSFVVFDPDIFLDNFLILDEKEENKQEYYEKVDYDEFLWKEFKKTEAGIY